MYGAISEHEWLEKFAERIPELAALAPRVLAASPFVADAFARMFADERASFDGLTRAHAPGELIATIAAASENEDEAQLMRRLRQTRRAEMARIAVRDIGGLAPLDETLGDLSRSEEHTSELQSLMRISYDVVCLKKKK